jgi:acetolactate decarboxylase
VSHQIALPDDLSNKLADIAKRTGRSPSQVAEQALQQFLGSHQDTGVVYLSAPASALMKGLYEENTTIAEVKRHGDFGLGTFNDLDGEMVMIDGIVYQLKADGHTHEITDAVQTPFACVTFFKPTTVEEVSRQLDYAAFKNLLYRLLPSTNMFYALRIEGAFTQVKVWSVSKQENYRPINEVTTEAFEYNDVEGTIVGFYTPDFIKSLSMAGYHLHFLTADREHGGHLQYCELKSARIGVQFVSKLVLNMPMTLDYLTTSLA